MATSVPRPTALIATQAPSPGRLSASDVGQRVSVGGEVTGVLRFYGPTHLEPLGLIWCGVELDTPDGLNDGCVKGVRYFRCRPKYGILAPEQKVRLVVPSQGGCVTTSSKKTLPQIKRRVPPDRNRAGRREKTSESGSASSQDEITPPAEEQPDTTSSAGPEIPRQPRSATATPTPGTSSAVTWETWSVKTSPQEGDRNSLYDDPLLADERDPTKDIGVLSPSGSEGCSLSQRRQTAGHGLILPLGESPPSHQVVAAQLGSKQSSFELDDSLGILTPDQMATDFTITSAGGACEDEERPGSAELGSDEPAQALSDETLVSEDKCKLVDDHLNNHEPEDHSEQFSDMSSAADTTSKGAACSSSQPQSTSSSITQQSTATSIAVAPSCSFITSVTSITSLDNGYQGDGEWSRPASRADNSPTVPPPPPGVLAVDVHKLKFDVMTDSDFFSDPGAAGTESDAEHEAAGMTVGDRRARVIDGTLYGTSPANSVAGPLPAAPAHLMTSSAATIEEMDSSGIFSDIDRRPDTAEPYVPAKFKSSELAEEASQPPEITNLEEKSDLNISEVLNTTFTVAESVTSNESPKSTNTGTAATCNKEIMKKHKMPKRNVTSKIKALIESSSSAKPDENQENRRPARKGGKWDAVMNKIAQNKEVEKARPKLKEVKSRVFAATTQPDSLQSTKRATTSAASRVNTSRPNSARTRRENASVAKSKPRRSRLRGAESSASLRGPEEEFGGPSPNSSHCSSISDVSHEPCLPKTTPLRSTKKRAAVLDGVSIARAGSPLSDVSTNSAATQPSSGPRTPAHNNNNALHTRSTNSPVDRGAKTQAGGVASVQQRNQRNSLLSAAATPPVSTRRGVQPSTATHNKNQQDNKGAAVTTQVPDMKTPIALRKQQQQTPRIAQKPTPLRDHNRVSGARATSESSQGKNGDAKITPVPATPGPPPAQLLKDLQHASAGCEAMGVLVQYLVHTLDAYSAPQLKVEVATLKQEWVRTKLELEEAQAGYRRLQESLSDELAAHERREEAQKAEHEEQEAALIRQHTIALESAHNERQVLERRLNEELEIEKAERAARELTVTELSRELKEAQTLLTRRAEESAHREAELGEQLAKVSAELAESKAYTRRLNDSLDKETKMQVAAERTQKLQMEVDSLQAVLELKHVELSELRKYKAIALDQDDKLKTTETQLSAMRSKVEDLESQLNARISSERHLRDENKSLSESVMIDSQKLSRLSQTNEELQWKLKASSEVINRLSSNSPMTMSLNSPMLFPVSPLMSRRSNNTPTPNGNGSLNNNSHRLSPSFEDDLPESPRVKVMSSKNDSVAWVLDMNESVEDMLERVHANQRQRCQDRSSPGRCLPKKSASTSAILSDHRSGKLAGRKSRVNRGVTTSTPLPEPRCRSRSVSTDSESLGDSSKQDQQENGIEDSKTECLGNIPKNQPTQPSSPSTMLSLPFKIQLQPQEGAGEAMISEEISDDCQSDCDANQAACSGRSSESSSLVIANGSQIDIEDVDDDDEDVEVEQLAPPSRLVCPTQPLRTSPTLDSVSQLGPTDSTAMDFSWSEDLELLPSECEG